MKGVIQSQRSRTDRVYSVVGIEIYMYTYLFQLWKSVFMCQGNIRIANFSPLSDLSLASHKRDIGKQCRPRSDAAEAPIVTENNKIWAAHDRTYKGPVWPAKTSLYIHLVWQMFSSLFSIARKL